MTDFFFEYLGATHFPPGICAKIAGLMSRKFLIHSSCRWKKICLILRVGQCPATIVLHDEFTAVEYVMEPGIVLDRIIKLSLIPRLVVTFAWRWTISETEVWSACELEPSASLDYSFGTLVSLRYRNRCAVIVAFFKMTTESVCLVSSIRMHVDQLTYLLLFICISVQNGRD